MKPLILLDTKSTQFCLELELALSKHFVPTLMGWLNGTTLGMQCPNVYKIFSSEVSRSNLAKNKSTLNIVLWFIIICHFAIYPSDIIFCQKSS
jgi:hypothetical protein